MFWILTIIIVLLFAPIVLIIYDEITEKKRYPHIIDLKDVEFTSVKKCVEIKTITGTIYTIHEQKYKNNIKDGTPYIFCEGYLIKKDRIETTRKVKIGEANFKKSTFDYKQYKNGTTLEKFDKRFGIIKYQKTNNNPEKLEKV